MNQFTNLPDPVLLPPFKPRPAVTKTSEPRPDPRKTCASSGRTNGIGYDYTGPKLLKERRRDVEDVSMKSKTRMTMMERDRVDLILRSIRREDLQDVMRLHSLLFPVKYNDQFYDRLFSPNVFTALAFVQSSPPRLVGIATGRVTYSNGDMVDMVPPKDGWEIQIGEYPVSGRRHCVERLRAVRGRSKRELVTGYVMTLGAMPEVRNLGLGTILLQTLTNFFVRQAYVDRIELDVLTENIPAVKFYLKHGFFVADRKNGYYEFDGKHYDSYQMIFNPYVHVSQQSQRQRSHPWPLKPVT